jgi:outer membrane lipoprotein SlyB
MAAMEYDVLEMRSGSVQVVAGVAVGARVGVAVGGAVGSNVGLGVGWSVAGIEGVGAAVGAGAAEHAARIKMKSGGTARMFMDGRSTGAGRAPRAMCNAVRRAAG